MQESRPGTTSRSESAKRPPLQGRSSSLRGCTKAIPGDREPFLYCGCRRKESFVLRKPINPIIDAHRIRFRYRLCVDMREVTPELGYRATLMTARGHNDQPGLRPDSRQLQQADRVFPGRPGCDL